ncbi:MAG: hypothetical protein HC819_08775 [Cyclobacteriaceae bacterium]|nr:hypothetical protein [Cyclobacteriaceae bacterium]
MDDVTQNKKIEKACSAALEKFQKIGLEKYADIQSKLAYVLGSYQYDGNPVGLYEMGEKALSELQELQKERPRMVSKKLITDLENALKQR